MIQAPRRTRLAVESLHVLGVDRERGVKDLESDIPAQSEVAGTVDLTHAPGAEQPHDLVGAEPIAR